eukprot:scaffold36326_cov199-Amphora_coffeaeformis.AAC.1
MGNKNSYPAPTEEDLNDKGAAISPGLSAPANQQIWFTLPNQAWWKENATEIEELGVKLVVVNGEDNSYCLVYQKGSADEKEADTIVAILREPINLNHRPLQIFVLAPPSPESQPVTKFENKKLYEYATVSKDFLQFILRITAAHTKGPLEWRTDPCRSAADDWILHCVDKQEGTKSNKKSKPILAAYFQQQPKRMWGCRVALGADPLLVLCCALCADRWRNLEEAKIRARSGVKGVYHPGVFKTGNFK